MRSRHSPGAGVYDSIHVIPYETSGITPDDSWNRTPDFPRGVRKCECIVKLRVLSRALRRKFTNLFPENRLTDPSRTDGDARSYVCWGKILVCFFVVCKSSMISADCRVDRLFRRFEVIGMLSSLILFR